MTSAAKLKEMTAAARKRLAVQKRAAHKQKLENAQAERKRAAAELKTRTAEDFAYFKSEMEKAAKKGRSSYHQEFFRSDDPVIAEIKRFAKSEELEFETLGVKKDNGGYDPRGYIGDMAECGIPRYESWWETRVTVRWK